MKAQVKVVYWVRRQMFTVHGPIEQVMEETIIDMGDMGIFVWNAHECFRRHCRNMEHYMEQFKYSIQDPETDIQIVELGSLV